MRISTSTLCALLTLTIGGCAQLRGCMEGPEVPEADSPADCEPLDLGAAEKLASRQDLPVDRVVTLEGMPHPPFLGWNQEGRKRAVRKILGTNRRILLAQEYEGEAPEVTTKMTGLLRRWSDLPSYPWDGVRQGLKSQYNWDVPEDGYVLLEGVRPRGCSGAEQ